MRRNMLWLSAVLGFLMLTAMGSFLGAIILLAHAKDQSYWTTCEELAQNAPPAPIYDHPCSRFAVSLIRDARDRVQLASGADQAAAQSTGPAEPPPLPANLPWPAGPRDGVTLPKQQYDSAGRPIPSRGPQLPDPNEAGFGKSMRMIVDSAGFIDAIRNAQPGDVLRLSPGTYDFTGTGFELNRPGTAAQPIVIGAAKLGEVRLRFNMLQGFHVSAPYWVIENLVIDGVCADHSRCEHAFHIINGGRSVVIRNNRVRNFNAHVKVSTNPRQPNIADDGLVEFNEFTNDTPRDTDNAVDIIDIVAGSGWVVRRNIITDFEKLRGNQISYAGFFKAAGENGIFEQNFVACEWKHSGGIRLGLSMGGGLSTVDACRDGSCEQEHTHGTIRNNIIANCPADVGLYISKGRDTQIYNNLLMDTGGIDIRFPSSTARIFNNYLDERILGRQGGTFEADRNFRNPAEAAGVTGLPIPDGVEDFCGRPHNTAAPAIGPFASPDVSDCARPSGN